MMNSLELSDALAAAVRQETMGQVNSLPSSLGLTPGQISEAALTRLEEQIQQQISQTVTQAVIQAQAELGFVAIHVPKSRFEDGRTKLGGDVASATRMQHRSSSKLSA
jgi:hypothetical protein